jgi:hypothetical protein
MLGCAVQSLGHIKQDSGVEVVTVDPISDGRAVPHAVAVASSCAARPRLRRVVYYTDFRDRRVWAVRCWVDGTLDGATNVLIDPENESVLRVQMAK